MLTGRVISLKEISIESSWFRQMAPDKTKKLSLFFLFYA
jgi:hypothetical protein